MPPIVHKKEMPFGWVTLKGKRCPAFICSVTGEAITPSNPGTLYWNPDSGEMIVLSAEGEDQSGQRPSNKFYSTELDVFVFDLLQNTVGPKVKELMQKVEILRSI
jgi:hypothetical protein